MYLPAIASTFLLTRRQLLSPYFSVTEG